MKLKYYKTYKDSQVTVNLSLTKFTDNEKSAIKILGAPTITLSKTYENTDTIVDIDTTIASTFSEETVFSGTTDNIDKVIDEVDEYINDVKDIITEKMAALMIIYNQIKRLLDNQSGELLIADGEENNSSEDVVLEKLLLTQSGEYNISQYKLKNAKIGGRGVIDTPKFT